MHISKIAFKLIRLLSELLLLNGLNPKTPTSNQKSIFVHKLLFTRNKLGYLEYKARDNNEQIKYNSVFSEANFSFSFFFDMPHLLAKNVVWTQRLILELLKYKYKYKCEKWKNQELK